MKKELIKSLKILALALLIGGGTSLVFGDWAEPAGAPPYNATAPVNESSSIQTKPGTLNVINDDDTGKATADILSIFGTSYFAGDVRVGDADAPYFKPEVDIFVTGEVGINLDPLDPFITPAATEAIDVNGSVRFSDLSQTNNPDADFPAEVCMTTSGTLVLCPQPADLFGMIEGPDVSNQHLTEDVFEHNADDHDCHADVGFTATSSGGGPGTISYSWKVRLNSDAPLVLIDGADASGNVWKNVGTGAAVDFTVAVKNPQSFDRDDWTVELTTMKGGETDITTQDFEVWTIPECND